MKKIANQFYRSLGLNIKQQRKLQKIGQDELAQLISLSRSSLSNIEIGKHQPSILTIYEIALALECSLSKLLPPIEEYNTDHIEEKFVEEYNSASGHMSMHNRNILKTFIISDQEND